MARIFTAERIRAALDDTIEIVSDPAAARASYVLRNHVLGQLALAVDGIGAPIMLLKGAALAEDVYPRPWQREMSDIDLLVAPEDLDSVVAVLCDAGFVRRSFGRDRTHSARFFEVKLDANVGGCSLLIELHCGVDKIARRPVDYPAIFARALPHPAYDRFLIPDHTDHVLLVVLHASLCEFEHVVAWPDLALLFRSDVEFDALLSRAREWQLQTATWIALSTLRHLADCGLPEPLLDELRPSAMRRWVLGRSGYRAGSYPVVQRRSKLGSSWLARQFPLRDDPLRWLGGVATYAASRCSELLGLRRPD
jgi:hypothetical protein